MPRFAQLATLLLPLTALGGGPGDLPGFGSQPPSAEELVSLLAVSERTALVPGTTSTIALVFEIEPKWHLYWRNAGDSGAPPSWTVEAPEGVSVGEPQWPVPERLLLPGNILNHIYEERLALLLPVTVADDVPSGEDVTLRFDVEWLVCKEICLFGTGETTLTLPVADAATASSDAQIFEATRARLPRPPAEVPGRRIEASFADGVLDLRVPGAKGLIFYPHESSERVRPRNTIADCIAGADRLRIPYRDTVHEVERVSGVLEILDVAPDARSSDDRTRTDVVLVEVPTRKAE